MNDLHQYLTENRVRLSIRKGVLRMSIGLYNTEEDIDRVLELCGDWVKSTGVGH